MEYLVVSRNAFETVALSATSLVDAQRIETEIREGFEDQQSREQHDPVIEQAARPRVVILSRVEGGTVYREG